MPDAFASVSIAKRRRAASSEKQEALPSSKTTANERAKLARTSSSPTNIRPSNPVESAGQHLKASSAPHAMAVDTTNGSVTTPPSQKSAPGNPSLPNPPARVQVEPDLTSLLLEDALNIPDESITFSPSPAAERDNSLDPSYVAPTVPIDRDEWAARFEDPLAHALDLLELKMREKLVSTLTSPASATPEGVAKPLNNMQPTVPNLLAEASTGDIVVGASNGPSSTYAANIEPDDNIRLSSTYAKNLPRSAALVFLPPVDWAENTARSLETRWKTVNVLLNSMQQRALESYAAMVVSWLEWCEAENITAERRFPADPSDAVFWLSTLCNKFSPGYAKKHLLALTFWHQLHILKFDVDPALKTRVLRGAANVAKAPLPQRNPATIKHLQMLADYVANETQKDSRLKPRSAAILACAVTAFFGMARLKDVVVDLAGDESKSKKKDGTRRKGFDPKYQPHGEAFTFYKASDEHPPLVKYTIPYDKVDGPQGSSFYLAQQLAFDPRLDPVSAIKIHLALNHPKKTDPAFAFIGSDGTTTIRLTRSFFMKKMNEALAASKLPPIKGHSFRIGGATFYKLAGVDSSIIRSQGRWASDKTYQVYQREKERTASRFLANKTPDDDDFEPESSEDEQ